MKPQTPAKPPLAKPRPADTGAGKPSKKMSEPKRPAPKKG